jgi:hypothetical protein
MRRVVQFMGRAVTCCGFMLIVLAVAPLYSQGTSGNITGKVLDPSGAAVPAVRIVARNVATGIENCYDLHGDGRL